MENMTMGEMLLMSNAMGGSSQGGGGGGSVQPDWNQNDENAPDYVKNRPFYTGEPETIVLLEEETISFEQVQGITVGTSLTILHIEEECTYVIDFDGVSYECMPSVHHSTPILGNPHLADYRLADNHLPFINSSNTWATSLPEGPHTISVSQKNYPITKIPKKYLPPCDIELITVEHLQIPPDDMVNIVTKMSKGEAFLLWKNELFIEGGLENNEPWLRPANNPFVTYCYPSIINPPEMYVKYVCTTITSEGVCSRLNLTNKDSNLYSTIEPRIINEMSYVSVNSLYIEYGGIILHSSTPTSSKLFRISVDDSGTISAAEVTT